MLDGNQVSYILRNPVKMRNYALASDGAVVPSISLPSHGIPCCPSLHTYTHTHTHTHAHTHTQSY